jgi:hypothetical protein
VLPAPGRAEDAGASEWKIFEEKVDGFMVGLKFLPMSKKENQR